LSGERGSSAQAAFPLGGSRRQATACPGESRGAVSGVVELPLDLAWSGDRHFDLSDPVQRYLYHMTVLTSAVTREHYTNWLNAGLLRRDWGRLRLPRPLREIWQEHFPELRSG